MWRRPEPPEEAIRFDYEGHAITARAGDTVAAALMAAGETTLRMTAVTGSPRAPYCMMGVCFECLMEIDGVGNRQACLTPVSEGMRVRRQRGARGVL
jgi:predicted molibdopterin-dependent oxidoreductase YjgC